MNHVFILEVSISSNGAFRACLVPGTVVRAVAEGLRRRWHQAAGAG